ncbi:MAG: response regulator transcription factor [Candidatus Competibacteraceae bacterium]|nr:response regulator transcription factor [Candidatus Competibacteraceae bacterium]MCB1810262.1 response regulator transcription factor [Candidatus Competibacteraceae bacterium]
MSNSASFDAKTTDVPALVLIVDDDIAVRQSLQRLLSSAGYEVELFASGGALLQRLPAVHAERPRCIVLDMVMPELDGLQLQDQLAAHEYYPPIIFLTGQGSIPATVQAMQQGAIDFLEKPVDETDLLPAIERALSQDRQNYRHWQEIENLRRQFSSLSERELEVVRYVIAGQRNKQVAYQLGISEKTVKVHRARAVEKLGVKSLAELVQLAAKAGISPLG